MSLSPMRRIVRLTLIAVCGITVVVFASGCASGSATKSATGMPHLAVSTEIGPKPHEWAITVAATGGGKADAGVVLTYPDGHTRLVVTLRLENGATAGASGIVLPNGTYRYAVYAAPALSPDPGALPASERVDENIVESETFTIP